MKIEDILVPISNTTNAHITSALCSEGKKKKILSGILLYLPLSIFPFSQEKQVKGKENIHKQYHQLYLCSHNLIKETAQSPTIN